MHKLYSRSSPVDQAYLVDGSQIFVGLDNVPPQAIPADRFVVGSLEYFLADFAPRNDTRLFDLYVADKKQVRAISFSTVEQMMTQFKFGFNSNIFLSRLIEYTNTYALIRSRQVPRDLWQYQQRAQHFSRLTDQVMELAKRCQHDSLQMLATKKTKADFYIDGVILSRKNILRAVSVSTSSASEFVQRFPKNAYLCREGNAADSMYFLLQGKIAVGTRQRHVATISQSGEAFGELALFLDGKRTASLVALENTLVYEVKRRRLPSFFRAHPDLFQTIARTLARRIHDNIENIKRFENKVAELSIDNTKKLGSCNLLELRSRHELTILCEELLEVQEEEPHPELERLLQAYGITAGSIAA